MIYEFPNCCKHGRSTKVVLLYEWGHRNRNQQIFCPKMGMLRSRLDLAGYAVAPDSDLQQPIDIRPDIWDAEVEAPQEVRCASAPNHIR